MLSDDQLVKAIKKGRVEHFSELMRRHQDAVFRLACRILGGRERAEDAVQETFLRAYQHLADYRGPDRFGAWVRRIAVNICLRKSSNEVLREDMDSLEDSDEYGSVEAQTLSHIRDEDIRRAVDNLPALYRTAVLLKYMEGLSYAEIADAVQEPVTTVQMRLHRAKKMLSERLAVMLDEV